MTGFLGSILAALTPTPTQTGQGARRIFRLELNTEGTPRQEWAEIPWEEIRPSDRLLVMDIQTRPDGRAVITRLDALAVAALPAHDTGEPTAFVQENGPHQGQGSSTPTGCISVHTLDINPWPLPPDRPPPDALAPHPGPSNP